MNWMRLAFKKTNMSTASRLVTAVTVCVMLNLSSIGQLLAQTSSKPEWQHAMALTNSPRYGKNFPHFDYVNPNAPKGGAVRLKADGTFDSFNALLPKGTPVLGLGLIYDTLMTSSLDEVDATYGLIAEAVQFPQDSAWVKFKLREDAKWHDGMPITADDVIYSFKIITEINPTQKNYYSRVKGIEKTGPLEVMFTFHEMGNKELPKIMGDLLVLPKHFWEGVDANGNKRDIRATTQEIPLGSGPYRIKEFRAGKSVTYARVPEYWAKDLNVNVGQHNFDIVKYEYYRDNIVALEAFKADEYDWRIENVMKNWATSYDFAAVNLGHVKREKFSQPYRASGVMLGFIFNTRRDKFKDINLRRAMNYAFDFEQMNSQLFFDQYERIDSYFFGNEFESSGVPEGLELEILNTVRDLIPNQVLTTQYANPVNRDRRAKRANQRRAFELFQKAGYRRDGPQLVHAQTGEQLTITYLINGPFFERVALRLKENLESFGINFVVEQVDSSQYANRVRERDFDMIYNGWVQSLSPGNEQYDYFGSQSVAMAASSNYAGIADPAIDTLIERIVFAKDRQELIAVTKAMDRVLLWNQYLIPGWTLGHFNVARWDRFSHPEPLPEFAIGFPTIWWFDEAKAEAIGR